MTVSHHRRPFLTQENPWKIEPHLFIFAFQNCIYITTLRRSWSITITVVKICHRHSPTYDPFNFSPLFFSVWRVLLIFFFIVNLFFLFLCFPFTLFFPLFFCSFFLSVRLMFVCHVFLCSFFFRYHFFSFFSFAFSFITPLPLSHIFFI